MDVGMIVSSSGYLGMLRLLGLIVESTFGYSFRLWS